MAGPVYRFVYNTSSGPLFDWSTPSNWATGLVPPNGVGVEIPAPPATGDISYDDIATLSLHSLDVSSPAASLEIAAGDKLSVSGGSTTNDGLITLDPRAVLVAPALTNLGDIDIGVNARLQTTDIDNTGTYHFAVRDSELFMTKPLLNQAASARITNFSRGDTIFLNTASLYSPANYTYSTILSGGTLQVLATQNGVQNVAYMFEHFGVGPGVDQINAAVVRTIPPGGSASSTFIALEAVCFLEGTRIETETGLRPVETIKPGDRVWAVAKSRMLKPVRWVGERQIDLGKHPHPEGLYPVRIRSGALDDGLPHRDLLLSPNHCLLVDGQLVPVKLLINGMSVVQDRSFARLRYLHIELDEHEAVLAEGVAAETYLDTENRGFFVNSAVPDLTPHLPDVGDMAPWQDRLCAPLRLRTEEVEDIFGRLSARALDLGYPIPQPAVATDPDLRMAVNGREFYPVSQMGGRYTFVLPASGTVRIRSRAGIPADLDRHTNDWRRLGVAVTRIVLRAGDRRVEIMADNPMLADGWHMAERDSTELWRWTCGDAALPIPSFLRGGGLIVELQTTGQMIYALESDQAQARAA